MLLSLNFFTYAALSVCTGLMLVGVIFPPITLCGFIGHCCGCLLQLAVIVVTAVYRYSDQGKMCADSRIPITEYDKDVAAETFYDHGDLIQKLFISQCTLYLFFYCFVYCALQISLAGSMAIYGR